MMTQYLSAVLVRELDTMRDELLAYADEADIWKTPPGITNPTGTLALHVAGNLRHFIGATLGSTGYVRDREAEFTARDVPRATIIDRLDAAAHEVRLALGEVDVERLEEPYPIAFGDVRPTTAEFLLHLAVHLAFHVGQAGYHRRLVTGDARSTSGVAIGRLDSATRGG